VANEVLAVVRPELGALEVTGADRLEWLNGVLTCDVLSLVDGEARWGLALTKQGKVVTEVFVLSGSVSVTLAVSPGTASAVAAWLDGFLIMEDAEVADVSEAWSWATFHGTGSAAAAAQLVAARPGWRAAALDFTPAGGALVLLPRADLEELSTRAEARAGIHLASLDEWEGFRVRHLLPAFGQDFSEKNSPHDASMERRAVSWTSSPSSSTPCPTRSTCSR
jgi:folate-binding Fe-S cluster repair protein YgfZ